MPFWANKINPTVCHLRNTETFLQLSLSLSYTRARAHTHSGRRCGNTWFLGAALGARHLLSRLDSNTFSTLPVPAAGTRGVLSWAATPPHHCITTPKSTRQRHPPTHTPALPFNTPLLHPSWTFTHHHLPAQLEIILQSLKVTDGALTRYSLLLNSWIGADQGGSPR